MKQFPEELYTNETPWGEMPVELKEAFAVATVVYHLRWELRDEFQPWAGDKYNRTPCCFPQIVYRLYREPITHAEPPWDVLPEWINHVAMDEYGKWFGYENEPSRNETSGLWLRCGGRSLTLANLRFPRGNAPWDQSLVSKPGVE